MVGIVNQVDSRGLYIHDKDSLLKVRWVYPQELRKTLAYMAEIMS